MNQTFLRLSGAVMLLFMLAGHVELGLAQQKPGESSAVVIQRVMTTAVARCHTTINGVRAITFESPTNEEFAEVKALGPEAVAPLARYLDLEPRSDFAQLIAVKFLMVIGGPSTLAPLKRAFAQDQWDVTRAAALDGMFAVSQVEAKPFVEAALQDKSQVVRQRAQQLRALYQQDN